jgi:hypothetical protein
MPTSRPFAYNPSQTFIPGIELYGALSVGPVGSGKITGLTTWNGPDEDLGYVIAKVVPGNSQPTPIAGVSASVGFYRSSTFTEEAFLLIANRGIGLNYSDGSLASNYLLSNGYWTNYPTDDPDALIYMNALNSVGGNSTFFYDPSIINQLFIGLKTAGLYDKMEAFYPMMGNSGLSQRLNAKSVGGVRQSGFDLFFSGGWNFNYYSNGPYTARGNGFNTLISVNKQYTTLASLKDTHFAVYGNDLGFYPGGDTAAADVFAVDLYTTNGIEYRFVEMRLANSTNPNNNEPRTYDSTYDYPGNILPQAGPVINTNVTSTRNSFAIMSYDNILDNGTNNFRINGTPYTNYDFDAADTVPRDPANTTYGAELTFGYYYDWYYGQQFYTGAAYGWLGFGTSLDATEQSNYQSIVNTFMQGTGKSTY